ncbi:MAG: RNA-binding protein [Magnetospirillum sp. WYHS-4]
MDEEPTGKSPFRRCIATRTVRPKAELVRFVVDPGGAIVPDVDERLPGRGLWCSATRDMIDTACKKGLFAKAAQASVKIPPGLSDQVEDLLLGRCENLLGLARRAGQLVAGFDKVREALGKGEAGLLVEAADGAADGRAKLESAARGLPRIEVLRAAELGRALGREYIVHVAVAPGRLAESLLREAGRLAGIRKEIQGANAPFVDG